MALMYPWATKEYLLWDMTIGQIVMYHNKGIEVKYGKPERKRGLADMGEDELREFRDSMRAQADSDVRAGLRDKYGEIDG